MQVNKDNTSFLRNYRINIILNKTKEIYDSHKKPCVMTMILMYSFKEGR